MSLKNQQPKQSWWEIVCSNAESSSVTIVGDIYWKSDFDYFVCEKKDIANGIRIRVVEVQAVDWRALEGHLRTAGTLSELTPDHVPSNASDCNYVLLSDNFLPLEKAYIKKPWGQEVWHTGSEKRGVCSIRLADRNLPLPYYELAVGIALAEKKSSLILLKELEPFNIEFYGELYTELHEEKDEVYIVSELPKEGNAEVKLGLAPSVELGAFASDLKQYEAIRKQVDDELEKLGVDFNQTGVEQIAILDNLKNNSLPKELVQKEKEYFERTRASCKIHRLSLGDVVRVPTHTPHALQPGTKVVEFQSPVYERRILSSNQKVLTQTNLDVQEGIDILRFSCSDPSNRAIVEEAISKPDKTENVLHTIASFEGFKVMQGFCKTDSNRLSGCFITAFARCQILYVLEGSLKVRVGQSPWQILKAAESYLLPLNADEIEIESSFAQILLAAAL